MENDIVSIIHFERQSEIGKKNYGICRSFKLKQKKNFTVFEFFIIVAIATSQLRIEIRRKFHKHESFYDLEKFIEFSKRLYIPILKHNNKRSLNHHVFKCTLSRL